jgi:glucoamylase
VASVTRPWKRGLTAFLAAGVALASVMTAAGVKRPPVVPRLYDEGIAWQPCSPGAVLAEPAGQADDYVPDTAVLRSRSANACARALIGQDREWLGSGQVPGDGPALRTVATRALLDLHLSERPDGAVIAGWHGGWEYSWPRDSSWVAVALADTGHVGDAYRILVFLARTQLPSGWWAARYTVAGTPVADGRPAELDADGWVPWAVWSWGMAMRADGRAYLAGLRRLWPMVKGAADAGVRALTPAGLPVPSLDYWEEAEQVTLGTAAPLLAGLRAAADIANDLGATSSARSWAHAAVTLANGVQAGFGTYGYHRLASQGAGSDAAVTFLGPPFGPGSPAVGLAVGRAMNSLTLPGGGVLPGSDWRGNAVTAWTAETAFFALYYAETGDHRVAGRILAWLAGHVTRLGSIPEMVDARGRPVSVAPLAWTDAVFLLALTAQAHPVPAPGRVLPDGSANAPQQSQTARRVPSAVSRKMPAPPDSPSSASAASTTAAAVQLDRSSGNGASLAYCQPVR